MNAKSKIIFSNDLFKWNIFLLAFSLPYSAYISSYVIFSTLICWFLTGSYKNVFTKTSKKFRNGLFISISLFIVYIFGVLNSSDSIAALSTLIIKLPLLALPLLFYTMRPSGTLVINTLKIFSISCFISTIICVWYAFDYRFSISNYKELLKIDWAYFSYALPKILSFHPPYYALFLVFSIFISLYFANVHFQKHKHNHTIAWISLSLFQFIFMVLLSSRTSFFAFFFVSTAIVFSHLSKLNILQKSFVFLGVVFIMFISVFNIPYLKNKSEQVWNQLIIKQDLNAKESSVGQKYYQWKAATNIIREHWLLGVGSGDKKDVTFEMYKSLNYKEGVLAEFNFHNMYLEIWAELGILGLAVLVYNLIYSLSLSRKEILFLIFTIVFVIAGLTESLLERQKGVLIYAFFNSLFLFYLLNNKDKGKNKIHN